MEKAKTTAEKAQQFMAIMKENGYPFQPIAKLSKKKKGKNVETSEQYTTRINGVTKDAIRLAKVTLVYDEVFNLIRSFTGEQKERWLVVEDLLNDEGIRIRTRLGIRARDNKTH